MTDDRYDQTDPDADEALADPVFDALFGALREAGCRPAPPVRRDLAALLSGAPGRRRRTVRGATAGLAVVGVLAGGVGAAAATGHLQQQRPRVARVADHSAEVRSAPPVTRPTPSVQEASAETEPSDVVDTRTNGVPDPQPARPPAGPTSAARGPETGDDAGDDDRQGGPTPTPAPQESEGAHADGDGGGTPDGGDDTGVSEGGTGDNGADGGDGGGSP